MDYGTRSKNAITASTTTASAEHSAPVPGRSCVGSDSGKRCERAGLAIQTRHLHRAVCRGQRAGRLGAQY